MTTLENTPALDRMDSTTKQGLSAAAARAKLLSKSCCPGWSSAINSAAP
jgi:hypothetical protein